MTPRTSSRSRSSEVADLLALGVLGHDAVELERQVGQRLADAVVEVPGDPRALLVGSDGAEPGEPAGVVDGQGDRLDEAPQQLDVTALKWLASGCSTARRPITLPLAGRTRRCRTRSGGPSAGPPAAGRSETESRLRPWAPLAAGRSGRRL